MGPNRLEYIATVDIFNEGVDIPEVNQILMLRRTESAIVFVQQLGRGLRRAADKEYVIVLDFIGNYEKTISSRQRFRMIARIRKKASPLRDDGG